MKSIRIQGYRPFVYVEGPSDKFAMEALSEPLVQQKRQASVIIKFFEAPKGDRKKSILTKVPQEVVSIIRNRFSHPLKRESKDTENLLWQERQSVFLGWKGSIQ